MADYGIIAERGELGAAIPMTPPPPPPLPFPQPCPIPVPAVDLIDDMIRRQSQALIDSVPNTIPRRWVEGFGDTYRHC